MDPSLILASHLSCLYNDVYKFDLPISSTISSLGNMDLLDGERLCNCFLAIMDCVFSMHPYIQDDLESGSQSLSLNTTRASIIGPHKNLGHNHTKNMPK